MLRTQTNPVNKGFRHMTHGSANHLASYANGIEALNSQPGKPGPSLQTQGNQINSLIQAGLGGVEERREK